MLRILILLLITATMHLPAETLALDYVVFKRKDQQYKVVGKVIVEASDGGRLLQTSDGLLWSIQANEFVEMKSDDTEFKPLTNKELGKKLLTSLPKGFQVYQTKHFLICYNTPKTYAKWIGILYERLYKGFYSYWKKRGMKLDEPKFPLVALVFANQQSYVEYSKAELGKAAGSIVGYYSFRTNRVAMYDLTGVAALRRRGAKRGTSAQINQILSQPAASQYVATIIHEAVHQLAFNSGMHLRYADIPLWVSEGIAVYLETPDLSNSKGWRKIGVVNPPRLRKMRTYMQARPADSLLSLIVDDKRFRNPKQAETAYAEAWALNYFLIKRKAKQHEAYLKMLSEKKQFNWDKPEQRLAAFKKAFGPDLAKLDKEFIYYIGKIRK